jgi:hypothetical protein
MDESLVTNEEPWGLFGAQKRLAEGQAMKIADREKLQTAGFPRVEFSRWVLSGAFLTLRQTCDSTNIPGLVRNGQVLLRNPWTEIKFLG